MPRTKRTPKSNGKQAERIQGLESELQRTRESLQGTIEELETSNEELKSMNEELQSTNEELQSANEELETSREEMQSLNEELQTVNAEFEERNRALSQANDDMQNLLNSTEIATVFLDDKLAIKRFTKQARKLFSLIDTDLGRPISDLAWNIKHEPLVEDAREVLRSLVYIEREIQTKEGAWRLMRIMPYRTHENLIDGLVMTFVDIDGLKKAEQEGQDARQFAEAFVDISPDALLVLDSELRVVSANRSFHELFQTTPKQVVGEPLQDVAFGRRVKGALIEKLQNVLAGDTGIDSFDLDVDQPRGGSRALTLCARRLQANLSRPAMCLLTVRDRAPK